MVGRDWSPGLCQAGHLRALPSHRVPGLLENRLEGETVTIWPCLWAMSFGQRYLQRTRGMSACVCSGQFTQVPVEPTGLAESLAASVPLHLSQESP